MVNPSCKTLTTETQRTQRLHREYRFALQRLSGSERIRTGWFSFSQWLEEPTRERNRHPGNGDGEQLGIGNSSVCYRGYARFVRPLRASEFARRAGGSY